MARLPAPNNISLEDNQLIDQLIQNAEDAIKRLEDGPQHGESSATQPGDSNIRSDLDDNKEDEQLSSSNDRVSDVRGVLDSSTALNDDQAVADPARFHASDVVIEPRDIIGLPGPSTEDNQIVETIRALREENDEMRQKLGSVEQRVGQLESLLTLGSLCSYEPHPL